MQKNRPIFFVLTLVLTTLSWDSVKQANAALTATKHMIAEPTGKVELIKKGSSTPIPASDNMEVNNGDLLKPAPGVRVRIICDDGNNFPVTAGVTSSVNELCPQPGKKYTNKNGLRRTVSENIPYIISPRATFLLTDKPILRWNGSTGANRFRVTVRGRKLNWTAEFDRNRVCQGNICEVVYPGDPPLQPGVGYKLIISTDTNRSSTEDTTFGLGFKLIDEGDAEEVETLAQQIEKQDLSDQTKALFLARRYADYNLIAEAIEILEALPKEKKIFQVYRWLGELYRQTGLILEAEVQYLQAVNLAAGSENLAELAAAKVGLGEIKYARSQVEESISLLSEAKKIYAQLEDVQRVQELNQRLEEWKR